MLPQLTENDNDTNNPAQDPGWSWLRLLASCFFWLPVMFSATDLGIGVILGNLALFLAFGGLYYLAFHQQGVNARLLMAAIALLCFFGTWLTPGTMALFGYLAHYGALHCRRSTGLVGLAATLSALGAAGWLFDQWNTYFLSPGVLVCLTLYWVGRSERQTHDHQRQQAASQQQIEHLAAVAERERIARDLHDLLGHTLSTIALKADLADKLGRRGDTIHALAEIRQVADITRQTLSEVRQAVSGYRAKDPSTELERLSTVLQRQGFTVDIEADLGGLHARAESTILLILREATTNILRHCRGDRVQIHINRQATGLVMSVADNGDRSPTTPGNGIRGIEERVKALGGHMTIDSQQGFSLNINFNNEVFSQ